MEQLLGLEFTAYVALALVLFAIRQATGLSNKYIPLVAIFLGIGFSVFENNLVFNFDILISGLKYALYGIGSVAAIKYALEKSDKK